MSLNNASMTKQTNITEVNYEKGFDLSVELQDRREFESSNGRVIYGNHPDRGWIYISFNPMGSVLILPFAPH